MAFTLKQMDLVRRFWPYVARYKKQMTTGVLLMVGMVIMDLAQPLPLKLLFDYIIGNQTIPGFLQPIYSRIGPLVLVFAPVTQGAGGGVVGLMVISIPLAIGLGRLGYALWSEKTIIA